MAEAPVRLTALAHGGGCGCKLAPAVLHELLAGIPPATFPDLLVGTETGDDAAVYRLGPDQAVIATTDFFTPIIDDPYDFGRIAAANALSDVYAMGGTPVMALAILGMPLGRLDAASVRLILEGGRAVCAEAGVAVAGGHSIDAPEPIYGLAVTGLVHPDRILRNSGAQAGDRLVLGKPLGVGILGAALKADRLARTAAAEAYAALVGTATRLNAVDARHALEMARPAGLEARIAFSAVPLLPGVAALAEAGVRTGAALRNWASYGAEVRLDPAVPDWRRDLLCDPQTSGGLLVAVAPGEAATVVAMMRDAGFAAAIVGEMVAGGPGAAVTAG